MKAMWWDRPWRKPYRYRVVYRVWSECEGFISAASEDEARQQAHTWAQADVSEDGIGGGYEICSVERVDGAA